MDKMTIIRAGNAAHELAETLAAVVRRSAIPEAHWDEVVERLKSLLLPAEVALTDELA